MALDAALPRASTFISTIPAAASGTRARPVAAGRPDHLCGAISQYMADGKPVGPSNYFKLAYANASMHGFQIYAFADRYAEAEAALGGWIEEAG
jgi:hypothetical protein